MDILFDSSGISDLIETLADQIFRQADGEGIDLIGIRSRGDEVAERLAGLLRKKGAEVRLGVLDISLYRDDLGHLTSNPKLQGSEIDFSIEGAKLIIVDDVLFTRRTVRAAFEALFDYGRPRLIELAVLIDRGHPELPIMPTYVGRVIETDRLDRVDVRLHQTDGEDLVRLSKN